MKLLLTLTIGAFMSINTFAGSVWKGTAVLIIKNEKLELFKKAVSKITEPTLKEKGCISYEGYQILDAKGEETNRFEFHEIWKTREAMMIDHKENSLHMQNFFKEIKINSDDTFLESFEATGEYVNIIK